MKRLRYLAELIGLTGHTEALLPLQRVIIDVNLISLDGLTNSLCGSIVDSHETIDWLRAPDYRARQFKQDLVYVVWSSSRPIQTERTATSRANDRGGTTRSLLQSARVSSKKKLHFSSCIQSSSFSTVSSGGSRDCRRPSQFRRTPYNSLFPISSFHYYVLPPFTPI